VAFLTNCTACHRGPTARGGDLLAPGGIGAGVTFESLLPIVRQGEGHPTPPGPVPVTKLDDADLHDLVAFIRSNAAP
jgi:mono/diheme cytochrome c family protein